jgi:hypothetical protein
MKRVCGCALSSPVREREREKEGGRERERGRGRERKREGERDYIERVASTLPGVPHSVSCTPNMKLQACSKHHSVSQSACGIIILIYTGEVDIHIGRHWSREDIG